MGLNSGSYNHCSTYSVVSGLDAFPGINVLVTVVKECAVCVGGGISILKVRTLEFVFI